MIEDDKKEFFTHIAGVYGFYEKSFSDFTGMVWWEAMKKYDLAAVKQALSRHGVNPDNGHYCPKPSDVEKMLQGSTQDSALIAWAKVDRGIRVVGTHRSVVFDDPLIHRVVTEMGGWIALGMKSDKEWPFQQNEFVNRYRSYRGRNQIPDFPPILIGISEASNGEMNRQHIEPPTLIGDAVKAEKVMRLGTNKPLLPIGQINAEAFRAIGIGHTPS